MRASDFSRAAAAMVALLLAQPGCEAPRSVSYAEHPATAAPPASASASTPLVPTGSTMIESKLRVQPLAAGFGGVGPATPVPYPDVWVVLILDIETSARLSGVEVRAIELMDPGGNVVARARPPWSLRRDDKAVGDDARRHGDFSENGTSPFDGEAEAGRALRLRVHAPLDTRSESLKPLPVRFRAQVAGSGDPGVWVEGALQGPWPTG